MWIGSSTGGSASIVTITTNEAEKRITDRGGAPPLLAAIEALIFHVAGIEDWVGGWPYYQTVPNQTVEPRRP